MKKSLMLCLTICCFAVSSLFAADSKEMFKNAFDKMESLKNQGISYNIHVVTGTKNKKTLKAKVYMKGEKIRIDAPQGSTIMDGNNVYIFSEKDNVAMKMNMENTDIKQATFDAIQDKADELNFVEKTTKNGYACQVFKSKDDGSDVEYYLTDDYGLPTYVKEETSETNITNFKTGNVKDSLFVLPEGVNIMDVSNFSPESLLQNIQ
ncbi:MAG: hypothetical protein IKN62_06010 [Elusimicrobia bacterium]|nr:hypothetical protein [Elusimicrobiota bacterium]